MEKVIGFVGNFMVLLDFYKSIFIYICIVIVICTVIYVRIVGIVHWKTV